MSEQARQLAGFLAMGPARMGELRLWQVADGSFRICHFDDSDIAECSLQSFDAAEDGREIAKFAEDGSFRVLKTSRNLRRGWILRLPDAAELAHAVEFIYPAALGQWLAGERDALRVIPFRETLARQSGIYRRAQSIGEPGIARVIEARCRAHCLRRILWPEGRFLRDEIAGAPAQRCIPLVCSEACNLLIADAAREVASETKTVEGET